MQESRHASIDLLSLVEELSSLEPKRRARLITLKRDELSCSDRMLAPECLDAIVGLAPPGYCRPPVAEDTLSLLSGSVLTRCRENVPDRGRHRVRSGTRVRSHGEPEATQIVVLVVVAVPATVLLDELEREPEPFFALERLLENENGIVRHVASAGTHIGIPGRRFVSIVCVLDGPGDSLVSTPVIKQTREGTPGRIRIGRTPRTTMRQVGVVEVLETKGRQLTQRDIDRDLGRVFRRCVALCQNRTILDGVVLL